MKTITSTANPLSHLSDESLIALVLSGQEEAFSVLVHRHNRLLRFILQRYLNDSEAVKDVIQDTFARAFLALPGYRGDSKFSTWLSRIAIRQAATRMRSKRFATWSPIEDATSHWEETLQNNETALEKKESGRLLREAVRNLGRKDATALELFYFREQSIEEIGQITGWTAGNIKSRLARARQRLRNVLGDKNRYVEFYS